MKACVYAGPRQIEVRQVPDPKIERATDALVRITSTNICGSDLHMYEGRTSVETGKVLGHENLGEVIEIGAAVVGIKEGDYVCLPFNISCGFCENCERGLTAFCLNTNPGKAGAAYGYADMGPYAGGQAEYLRVPFADFNCLKLPPDAREKEADYVMLADIFPTGYHATELADIRPGDSAVIYGAGPVGLLAAHSSIIRGARQVMVVDRHADRLQLVEKIGGIPIDDSKVSPVEAVLKHTDGKGADKGCECVGYQAHDPSGNERPNDTMNKLIESVRPSGRIGVVGVYVPEDPNAANHLAKQGVIAFNWGLFWHKGLSAGTGQANVKAYNRKLRDLIHRDLAKPSFLVSHQLPLEQAPEAYRRFDARDEGWTKVILKPELPS